MKRKVHVRKKAAVSPYSIRQGFDPETGRPGFVVVKDGRYVGYTKDMSEAKLMAASWKDYDDMIASEGSRGLR